MNKDKAIKRIFLNIITFFITILCVLPISAAERDYPFTVPKDYVSAKVTITFPDFRDYTAYVINEKQSKSYEAVHDESAGKRKLVCVINEPIKQGEWIVRISTQEQGNNEEIIMDENGEPMIVTDTTEEEISGVNISFEGNTEKVVDVNKEIVVATDIAGLSTYFKDDSFVVEWEDTTVGNVNIEVSDEVTMEVLDKATVADRYYELPLDPGVSSILVRIVPKVSSSMKDAEMSKIIKVENNPDADIVYEDTTITNKSEINVHARLGKDYKLAFYNNDEFKKEEAYKAGEYDIPFSLKNGENNLKIYVIDDKGNMRSTSWTVIQDTVAPILELKSQYQGVNTENENVTIEGKVQDYSSFQINDKDVKVEGDHTFAYTYELKEGLNQINLIAEDEAGNITSYAASVTRIIPEEPKTPVAKYILLGIIILIALIFIGITIKNHFFTYEYEEDEEEEEEDEEDDENEEFEDEPENEPRQSLFERIKNSRNNKVKAEKIEKPLQVKEMKTADIEKKQVEVKEVEKKPVDKEKIKDIVKDAVDFVLPIIILVLILTKVLALTVVESGSMKPTLEIGNTVVFNRLAYINNKEVGRGDIVTFMSDETGLQLSKRVIGIPGDEISFRDGYVVLNGQIADESDYIAEDIETNSDKIFTVPEGCYFMLGDNRENSYDSRFWENPYIPKDKIIGKYMGQIGVSFKYDVWLKLVGLFSKK